MPPEYREVWDLESLTEVWGVNSGNQLEISTYWLPPFLELKIQNTSSWGCHTYWPGCALLVVRSCHSHYCDVYLSWWFSADDSKVPYFTKSSHYAVFQKKDINCLEEGELFAKSQKCTQWAGDHYLSSFAFEIPLPIPHYTDRKLESSSP